MGVSLAMLAKVATIVGGIGAAGSAAYTTKAQIKRSKEEKHKERGISKEAQKEKERLARNKLKSPGQRLLGGRPTLG